MHILLHLIPRHHEACPVGAEDRSGRVLEVGIEIVAGGRDHLLGVVARFVAGKTQGQPSAAFRVGDHVALVISHGGNRGGSRKKSHGAILFRCGKFTLHPVKIRHGAPKVFRWDFQTERVVGF